MRSIIILISFILNEIYLYIIYKLNKLILIFNCNVIITDQQPANLTLTTQNMIDNLTDEHLLEIRQI